MFSDWRDLRDWRFCARFLSGDEMRFERAVIYLGDKIDALAEVIKGKQTFSDLFMIYFFIGFLVIGAITLLCWLSDMMTYKVQSVEDSIETLRRKAG